MLKQLLLLANKLDELGLYTEADALDSIFAARQEYEVNLPGLVQNIKALKNNIVNVENELKEVSELEFIIKSKKIEALNSLHNELSKYKEELARHIKYLVLIREKYPEIYKEFRQLEKITPEQMQEKYYSRRRVPPPALIKHVVETD